MMILLLLGFAAAAAVDLPGLLRQRAWRTLAVYGVFMLAALAVAVLRQLDVPLPNPVKNTQYLVRAVFQALHLTYN